MLKPILDVGKQVVSLTRDTQQNKEDIKTLREDLREARRELADYRHELMQVHQILGQVRQEMNQQRLEFTELTRVVERLAYELQRTRDNAAAEQKVLRLELENTLLRSGRILSPGEAENPPTESE